MKISIHVEIFLRTRNSKAIFKYIRCFCQFLSCFQLQLVPVKVIQIQLGIVRKGSTIWIVTVQQYLINLQLIKKQLRSKKTPFYSSKKHAGCLIGWLCRWLRWRKWHVMQQKFWELFSSISFDFTHDCYI